MSAIRLTSCALFLLLTFCHSFGKENFCYYVRFSNTDWTDCRPRFIVNMTFTAQGSVDSTTIINEEIASPITRISITQKDYKETPKTIYNVTTKLCNLEALFRQVPLIKPASENVLKQGNYSLSCPLRKGTYVMSKMRVSSKNPILAVMYKPKRAIVIEGGLYEQLPNKTLSSLSTYNITIKIIKKICAGNGTR